MPLTTQMQIAGAFPQFVGDITDSARRDDFANIEKNAAETHEKRLFVLRRRQYIKTVRRDVVRRGVERKQPEKHNRPLHKMRRRNHQRDAREHRA